MKDNHIFTIEDKKELEEVEKKLNRQGEIVITFSKPEWKNVSKIVLGEMKDFQDEAARKFFATKILTALEKKYSEIGEYNGGNFLPIFLRGDQKSYEEKSSYIYNLFDVANIVGVEEVPVERINIVTEDIQSPQFKNAIIELLSDDFPLDIHIYFPSSNNIPIKNFLRNASSKKQHQ